MSTRIVVPLLVAFALRTLGETVALAAPTPNQSHEGTARQSDPKAEELNQELKRIAVIQKIASDLPQYEKLANEIIGRWKAKDPQRYGWVVAELCKPLISGRFESEEGSQLNHRYLQAALQQAEAMSARLECELSSFLDLSFRPKGMSEQDFVESRRKNTELRLHGWKRVADGIDPKWDAIKESSEGLSRIASDGSVDLGISGLSREQIKNPKILKEYRRYQEEHRQKVARNDLQYELRQVSDELGRWMPDEIIRAYSLSPAAPEELENLLVKYVADKQVRQKILDGVEAGIEAQKADASAAAEAEEDEN